MKKYIVNVDVSYVHMKFKFDSMVNACNFMEMFLDHILDDKNEASVSMVRAEEEEGK